MRLDKLLQMRALAQSRTQAQRMIRAGQVEVNNAGTWRRVEKSSENLNEECELRIVGSEVQRYVSRAGLKLAGALDHLQLDVRKMVALDVGQSTGGFSDCLLQAGALQVVGIDVGHGQLASSLHGHPQLICIEGLNARYLSVNDIRPQCSLDTFDVIVMDVSFISQTLILPRLPPLLRQGGILVSLVKPQFEVGPDGIGKGGLVRDSALYEGVRLKIERAAADSGLVVKDYFESGIRGGDGNREFFLAALNT